MKNTKLVRISAEANMSAFYIRKKYIVSTSSDEDLTQVSISKIISKILEKVASDKDLFNKIFDKKCEE